MRGKSTTGAERVPISCKLRGRVQSHDTGLEDPPGLRENSDEDENVRLKLFRTDMRSRRVGSQDRSVVLNDQTLGNQGGQD